MTIDEEIKKLKDGNYLTNLEELKIADWLEELKIYRESSYGELHDMIYSKAIDDFIHECDKYCGLYSGGNKILTREDLLKIAEQLKAGVENENF